MDFFTTDELQHRELMMKVNTKRRDALELLLDYLRNMHLISRALSIRAALAVEMIPTDEFEVIS